MPAKLPTLLTILAVHLVILTLQGCGGASVTQDVVSGASTTSQDTNPTGAQTADVRAYASLPEAVTALGGVKTTLTISTSVDVSSDLTVPANIELLPLNGAIITVTSGTLTYNGATARWPLSQIFAGNGSVKLPNSSGNFLEWFGGKGDGATDSTSALEKALAAFPKIKVSRGQFNISHVDLPSNTSIEGSGWDSILYQIRDAADVAGFHRYVLADGMLTTNASSNSTVSNIAVSNIQLKSDIVGRGFDERAHLIAFSNVTGVVLDHVKFTGWLGDAVMLGGGLALEYASIAREVSIRNSNFDGINAGNRQAISFYSVDGAVVDNNDIANTTNASMPGAIDLEPDTTLQSIRNVTISNNRFANIGQSGHIKPSLAICLQNLPQSSGNRITNINFTGNHNYNADAPYLLGSLTNPPDGAVLPYNIKIANNSFDTFANFRFFNIVGVEVANNTFVNSTGAFTFGYISGGVVARKINFHDNAAKQCGSADAGVYIFNLHDSEISNNTFTDCGNTTGSNAKVIDFETGSSSRVKINNNVFSSPGNITKYAAFVTAAHTQDADSEFLGNALGSGITTFGWAGKSVTP